MWIRPLLAAVICLAAQDAFAWGRDGHRAVCHIAWEQLTPAAKTQTLDLLEIATEEQFADACLWADTVMKERPETAGWHAMTLPSAARAFEMSRDCRGPSSCAVEQIELNVAVLKGDAAKPAKADALKYLAHFIGDLHQPLNIGFTDHLQARKISTQFMGLPSNLHAVWEAGLLRTLVPPGKDGGRLIFDAAAWSGRLYGADKKTPLEWANETLWITVSPPTGYLGNTGGDVIGERYIRQNRPVALEQIDKAGVRLADILNAVLK